MDGTRKAVEVVRVSRKLPTCRKPQPEPEPIVVTSVDFSGSHNECVRLQFSSNLSAKQRTYVETTLQAHECYTSVHNIRWPDNKTLVVEVFRRTICECSRYDVEKVVKAFVIPLELH